MTLIMGVLNVTPDSFSDGGRYLDTDAAIAHGRALASAGAGIIDVGGESTRPGASRVSAAEETERVQPVIRALAAADISVSVDTTRSDVARAALAAGAEIVNDVSGGLADDAMAGVVAESGARWVLMHWRGHSDVMAEYAQYGDVINDVSAELSARIDAALAAGVARDRLILDPGLGFAKSAEHNWELLRRLDRLHDLGFPLLIGASRKSFLGALLASGDELRPIADRDAATLALSIHAWRCGAWGVRVHDVRATADAFAVCNRLDEGELR